MPTLTLGIVGIGPALVVHHVPERVFFDHGEVADHGDQNILHAFTVKRARQVMVVDHVVALVRPADDRDHVLTQELRSFLLRFVLAPAFALLLYLSHADRHLGWAKLENRGRMNKWFTQIWHDWAPIPKFA